MYKKNKNKTARVSQNMISDALLELMERKQFNDISVTEICDKAGVGRKTFYRNFETKEDVLDLRFNQLYDSFKDNIQAASADRQLYVYLDFIKENADVFITMYNNNLHNYISNKFHSLLPQVIYIWTGDEVHQEYISRYVVSGIQAMVRVWVEKGFTETTDELVKLAEKLIKIGE